MKILALFFVLMASLPVSAIASPATGDSQYLVYEFYAQWCPYCKEYKPLLDKVADEFADKIRVVPVDIDLPENKQLVSAAKVRTIPTVIIMDGHGAALSRLTGLEQSKTLADKLRAL